MQPKVTLLIIPLLSSSNQTSNRVIESQDVTISYNYIGILPANLLYDVMNGKAA